MMKKYYYVYILASKRNGTLYIGVTSNLIKRVWQHRNKIVSGFTAEYDVFMLVYFEEYNNVEEAIAREKYLKGKKRDYKLNLIEEKNPQWRDLYQDIIK